MIQANKLRIGNLFNYHDLTVNVVEITKQYAVFAYFEDGIEFSMAYSEYDFPKPIPLTPEWLTRAGFVKDETTDEDNYWMELRCGNFVFTSDESINCEFVYINKHKYPLATYVHQLQNLVKCLTGVELEFK